VSGITVDEVTKRVENTVYTAVGLGILGFQHLQVQRRELRRSLDAVLRQVADAAGRTAGDR
jgi:predicted urease superfamily metal-dependent hydrolase